MKPENFAEKLIKHTKCKQDLYDGFNKSNNRINNPLFTLSLLTEEVGEVASAIMRKRYNLAKEECIDVAHCALLLHESLERNEI